MVKLAGERVRYERVEPLVVRTVDEAPTPVSPVPPLPMPTVPERYEVVSTERVPIASVLTNPADARLSSLRMLADSAVIAVVEAYWMVEEPME